MGCDEEQTMIREIVTIDESKCDGCGLCVPACEEGAIKIVNGKAKLVSDRLCDGLGACLGHCPRGAITVEKRPADAFDEAAVAAAQQQSRTSLPTTPQSAPQPHAAPTAHGGCPGSRLMQFGTQPEQNPATATSKTSSGDTTSELTHWPVQLGLLPAHAPILRNASVLIAADCVPVAMPDFHQNLLRGRKVVIGCPKFDDVAGYVEKLTAMLATQNLTEVVVARMEVPCCMGIAMAAVEAARRAAVDTPVREVVVSTQGKVISDRVVYGVAETVSN
jgi:NAD-dependent dihydropyrimidine dehydrogenase PreA subunit